MRNKVSLIDRMDVPRVVRRLVLEKLMFVLIVESKRPRIRIKLFLNTVILSLRTTINANETIYQKICGLLTTSSLSHPRKIVKSSHDQKIKGFFSPEGNGYKYSVTSNEAGSERLEKFSFQSAIICAQRVSSLQQIMPLHKDGKRFWGGGKGGFIVEGGVMFPVGVLKTSDQSM